MSLNSIMSTAMSGLTAAQTGLTTASDNIANVNTPGYVRKVVDQSSFVSQGVGSGVSVADIRRVADQYLQAASFGASSQAGYSAAAADLFDQAQAAFGDPSSTTSYFNQLNSVFTAFSAAANDPASNLPRSQALDQITTFLDNTQRISSSLGGLSTQADTRIGADVGQINQLLGQIDELNTDITRGLANTADTTGSQDAQSELLDKLSTLMDIKIASRPNGGVVVRSGSGVLLAGAGGPATLSYLPSSTSVGSLRITQQGASASSSFTPQSGELRGLMDLRNIQLPAVQDQLNTFVSSTVDAINAAHNAGSAVPPPATLTGRNTGLDLPAAVSGFTGKTTIAIVDANGQMQQQVDIDFDAQTMSANGGAPSAFTPATFLASLNTALGGIGAASFSNGSLSLGATAAGNGVALSDDPTTPSAKTGRGFSQFFGLNDLISSTSITNYNTGLTTADANGFTPGDVISLRIADASGTPVRDVSIPVPAGPTMQDLLDSLNASVGGVGQWGSFSLDANGAMTFKSNTPGSASVSVLDDKTQRGPGGPSISQLFGVGVAQRAARASTFSVRGDIQQNPMNLSLAKLNLTGPIGQPVLALGDSSGALALSSAATSPTSFAAAGDFAALTTSVTQYAAQLGGSLGRKASSAASAASSATAVQGEATTRRQAVEGVNLDEELVSLTTYQQAYAASARIIQASKDMYDALLGMMN